MGGTAESGKEIALDSRLGFCAGEFAGPLERQLAIPDGHLAGCIGGSDGVEGSGRRPDHGHERGGGQVRDVRQELADPDAVRVLDGYGVPKKGDDSCGVARQWCGHLGKVDNCQVGYFLAYVAPRGKAMLDAQLYQTQDRAGDGTHRLRTYVPQEVAFQKGWRLALALLRHSSRVRCGSPRPDILPAHEPP